MSEKYKRNYNLETENDRKNWINKIFKSKACGDVKVLGVYDVNYNNNKNKRYICEFINTNNQVLAFGCQIKSGNVRDNLSPSLYGVGILGDIDDFTNRLRDIWEYKLWKYMIYRVYCKDGRKQQIPYNTTIVSDEWKIFKKFYEDLPYVMGYSNIEKYKDIKFELDKDILADNKIYSLATCCFVPLKLNLFFTNKQITNSTGYEGVTVFENKFRSRVSYNKKEVNLGVFDNAKEAYEVYHEKKKEILEEYLKEYNWLDDKIKQACKNKLIKQYNDTLIKSGGII